MTSRNNEFHVGRPNIGDQRVFFERLHEILESRWLTNEGPYSLDLEQHIAEYIGVKHCIAVCNATIGLEIAIRALGLTGEVIVPSFTFVATVHALQWHGIKPVFCDVHPSNHSLDPSRVERLITKQTTGVLGVHLWGQVCDVRSLQEIVDRHDLRLLLDAAHALGCSNSDGMAGTFGDAEVFSLHATKFINSFEGGAITTNNDVLAKKMRHMRNFGIAGYDQVDGLGINGKMHEVSAAMGLTNMESLEEFVRVNRRNYEAYQEGLAEVLGITLMRYEGERCNYQYVVATIDPDVSAVSRDDLLTFLHSKQVFARRYFYPGCHRAEPYRTLYPNADDRLPETNRLCHQVLVLPTGTAVTVKDIAWICQLIRHAMAGGLAVNGLN